MNGHTEDKPKDCRYCYFWKQTEGCTYRGKTGCYYISAQKPPAAISECDGCPYGRASPCIGWCTKELLRSSFYDAEEVNKLFEVSRGTKLEYPILFGAFYGLRRSEVLGLKWDAIDFENDSIMIRHTVTSVTLDGKVQLVAADTTKTKSSLRTLPLVPFVKERLLVLKKEQENNRRLCGRSYHKQYAGYVCINEMGDLIKPHYVTEQFPKLLDANGLRRIRFHDLRHSCASLMLANGVPMKQIQEWLGHSDFSTTANIYAHLDYSTKLSSADAMLSGLGFQAEKA